jgi:hypothetical protein
VVCAGGATSGTRWARRRHVGPYRGTGTWGVLACLGACTSSIDGCSVCSLECNGWTRWRGPVLAVLAMALRLTPLWPRPITSLSAIAPASPVSPVGAAPALPTDWPHSDGIGHRSLHALTLCLLALALAAPRGNSGRRPPIHASDLDAIARGGCPVCSALPKIPSSCLPPHHDCYRDARPSPLHLIGMSAPSLVF